MTIPIDIKSKATYSGPYVFFLCILVLFGNWACQPASSSPNNSEMQFRVNPELLGDSMQLVDVGISFSPPKTFEWMDKEQGLAILGAEGAPYVSSIRNYEVFTDSATFAGMQLIKPDINTESEFLEYYTYFLDSLATQDTSWQSAMLDSFPYNGFEVKQLLLQNAEVVAFFLVFNQKRGNLDRPFVCAYGIPREFYTSSLIQSIESSIGSFTPL